MEKTTNLDKENLTGHNESGDDANYPLHLLTATSIIGDKVENKHGEKVGKIKDIMLNIQEGKIQYIIMEFGGFLGMGEKLFAIPFYAFKVNPDKKDFILDIEKEFLEKAPGFEKGHWPETNSHYYRYNVTPYWGSFMGVNTGGGL
jgi:hypothetical protein